MKTRLSCGVWVGHTTAATRLVAWEGVDRLRRSLETGEGQLTQMVPEGIDWLSGGLVGSPAGGVAWMSQLVAWRTGRIACRRGRLDEPACCLADWSDRLQEGSPG